MNEPIASIDTQPGAGADNKPASRVISDPREVTDLVMARTRLVKVKMDELAAALNGLVDITDQLTRTYGAQRMAVEQLRWCMKALKTATAGAPGGPVEPPPGVQ